MSQLEDYKCPFCGSKEIEGDSVDTDGDGMATQHEFCNGCGSEWQNSYTLTSQITFNDCSGEK